jgi:hypothetical protein
MAAGAPPRGPLALVTTTFRSAAPEVHTGVITGAEGAAGLDAAVAGELVELVAVTAAGVAQGSAAGLSTGVDLVAHARAVRASARTS